MLKTFTLTLIFTLAAAQAAFAYPSEWWIKIPDSDRHSWEILPTDAKDGEVILSKRTELGIFSNLGEAKFFFDGQHYGSVEGLWQGMKYPDLENIKKDPRARIEGWLYKRADVYKLHGWESKRAGDAANKLLKNHGINWVSYKGNRFNYKDGSTGSRLHYHLIAGAIRAKVMQNPSIKALLLKTTGLILKADHKIKPDAPPSYNYPQILMDIREELNSNW